MEAQEVPAMQVAVQVARKKEMKTPRRLSKRRKNIGHLCTMPEGRPLESDAQKTAECRRCIESNGVWKECLTPNGHGCAACKEVIEARAWNKKMIKNHHYLNRDLVCPRCVARGYAPGKYDEHQCDECLEKFGSLKFDRKSKYNKKRNAKYRLVCKACQTKIRSTLRCSSCMGAYELTYWSKSERRNHRSPKHTNLVCKACRAAGFTPWSLTAYTCQTCACKFGAKKFDRMKLANFKSRLSRKLHCLQCESNEPARPPRLAVGNMTSDRWCVVLSAMNANAAAKAEEFLTGAVHKKVSSISKGECGMEVRFHSGLRYQSAWDLVDGLVGSQNRGWRIRPLGASGDSFRERPAVAVAAGARHG